MPKTYTFKFLDEKLNRKLIALVKKSPVKHSIGNDGVLHYSSADEEVVGNGLISSIREAVFPSWQILSCPEDWIERYKRYMNQHDVPFAEELIDNQLCFLLPRKYRPHSWKLDEEPEIRQKHRKSRSIDALTE